MPYCSTALDSTGREALTCPGRMDSPSKACNGQDASRSATDESRARARLAQPSRKGRRRRKFVVLGAIAGAALVVILSGCSEKTSPATNITKTSATINGTLYWNNGDGPGEWWWEYSANN